MRISIFIPCHSLAKFHCLVAGLDSVSASKSSLRCVSIKALNRCAAKSSSSRLGKNHQEIKGIRHREDSS